MRLRDRSMTGSSQPRRESQLRRILGSRWLIVAVIVIVVIAIVIAGEVRPGPVFSLSGLGYKRNCFYNTTQGNYSFWSVYFNITNRGASASAAVAISVDETVVSYQQVYVASSATALVHENVTDSAISTDPGCQQNNVTVGIWGWVF